jgi:hypothetical protein
MLNLNTRPYYDDFDSAKNFHKILFVPGNPVQARELTQIQSILQHQIKMQGDHIFKNGTMVIPGNVFYDNNVTVLRLKASYDGTVTDTILSTLIGTTLTSQSVATLTAKVIHVQASTPDFQYPLVFIKYTSASATRDTFNKEELLVTDTAQIIQVSGSDDYHIEGSICRISEGVFYINGYFVGVDSQNIAVKYDVSSPTCVVGLKLVETIVTAKEDASLYDNVLGFSNQSAPGADRYKIELQLSRMLSTDNQDNFIQLLSIQDGQIQYLNNKTKYSEIEKMMARRTYDESGNYVITENFSLTPKHMRNNFRGEWTANTYYYRGDHVTADIGGVKYFFYTPTSGYSGATKPAIKYGSASDGLMTWTCTRTPYLNNGVTVKQRFPEEHQFHDEHLVVSVPALKAYINGFEIDSYKQDYVVAKTKYTKSTSSSVPVSAGNYIVVSNIVDSLNFEEINSATIKDVNDTSIGSCFITAIEYLDGTRNSSGNYKLFVAGVKISQGYDYNLHANKIISGAFDSTIRKTLLPITGTVTTNGSTTVVGNLTQFENELSVGATVTIGAVTTTVAAITSNVTMTVADTVAAANNITMFVHKANQTNEGSCSLVKLPKQHIAKMRDENNNVAVNYTINKFFNVGTTGAGVTSLQVVLSSQNETFVNTANHVVFNTTTGAIVNPTINLDVNSKTMTLSGLVENTTYTMSGIVWVVGDLSKEKGKTLKVKTIILDSTKIYEEVGGFPTLSTAYNFTSPEFILTEADVQRIISVTQSGGLAGAPYDTNNEVDITSRYVLELGASKDYYGIDKCKLRDVALTPSSPIKVTFEYLDHSTGDFFTKSSYSSILEEHVQYLGGISLSDIIDFRSRMDDTGTGFNTGAGASLSPRLYSQSNVDVSYSYYLARADVLGLKQDGTIVYIYGRSDEPTKVSFPQVRDDILVLAKIFIAPNPLIPAMSFKYEVEKYKRYTMKDIGQIDNRLKKVEDYVAFTLLEKQTADINIKDENGLDRYKNGFVTDSFVDASIVDPANSDVSVDINNSMYPNIMKPMIHTKYLQCVENENTTASTRAANGYQVTGDVASLPYTVKSLISQKTASGGEFINPFDVVMFEGSMTLFPSSDIWEETQVTNRNEYI